MEILFEKGIPGFESYNYFNVSAIEGNERFYNIVSKEDSNIGFVSISPFEIKKDYEIELNERASTKLSDDLNEALQDASTKVNEQENSNDEGLKNLKALFGEE